MSAKHLLGVMVASVAVASAFAFSDSEDGSNVDDPNRQEWKWRAPEDPK